LRAGTVVSLSAVPGAESVRGKSMYGCSFVQVTFKDEIDFDWARGRVLDQLSSAAAQLPDGVVPCLGPEATGLGRVDYCTLRPPAEGMAFAELRSLQDFVVKYDQQAAGDIEDTVVMQHEGVPVRVSDVAEIQLGPDFRRAALDYKELRY
jgi:Cu(I)/Ag(I) efflux system membrane protein CusA/SilA